jgi:hypothetical protein
MRLNPWVPPWGPLRVAAGAAARPDPCQAIDEIPPAADMRISSAPTLARVGMPNRSDGDSKSDRLPPILIGGVLLAS